MKEKRYGEMRALKGKMRECNITYRQLAAKMGIGVNTLSDRLNGFYVMDIGDVASICEILDIQSEEIPKYFFCT